MSFLRPNLDTRGRVIRGMGAFVLAVAAWFAWSYSRAGGIALAAFSVFVAFEALRGWCALRACGVKTKF